MEIPRDRHAARDPELRQQLSRRARELTREVVGARLVRAVHGRFGLREAMLGPASAAETFPGFEPRTLSLFRAPQA